ncbi:MAG: MarR family transcriptional regulator [Mesorhizobium sp.]|uniref:MarR family winged helix-turn-helix transcriptional regulator n=1 Tax=Mesorhizobium sp. TaxID=1871066 RepID=UPI001220BBE4|nr:MarR family transcriptional regulator [Mesorhizobium sp.]TIT24965.1 MAG: MarR family transcriptional regulator [Mesorhizobium sp.]
MFDFLMRFAQDRLAIQQKLGLTPNDSRALFTLDKDVGKPIGALAAQWHCDLSTATWLVDRLEQAGLAERIPSPSDRRVKLVKLTPKGAATIEELTTGYHKPPAEMVALPRADLNQLIGLVRKLQAGKSVG